MPRYVLNLGDVRSREYQLRAICWADTREALEQFVASETEEPFVRNLDGDQRVRVFFRKDGPLEWCLPPWVADDRHYVEVPDLKDYLVNCGRDYRDRFEKLPHIDPESRRETA
jgi:hypothetical protein